MKSIIFLFFISIITFPIFSQSWTQVDDRSIPLRGERNINPQRFITAVVDDAEIKEVLWSAPDELKFDPKSDQHTIIQIMNADGNVEEFSIVRYQMMEPDLAKRYDHIRTFHGLSISSPARRIRINYTDHGLRATITDKDGQTYIDHLQRNDKNHKIIYRRSDFAAHEDWECKFKEENTKEKVHNNGDSRSGDCVFKSYRFAITSTGEYSNYHGATSSADASLVLSALVTTVDRVNDVYEQDITMRLILINNVDDIFYYDPATDPFSTNAVTMLGQNQANTDAVIGSANYDLGHIVSTGAGGVATPGVLCSNSSKARGATGIDIPEGDPFDIDYVAHEVGHQLGARHTFNNNCNGNRSANTAMEPGSGSTIMAYAGICSPNVQNNSDAYFHAISVQQMNAELASTSCEQIISLSNNAPVVEALTNKSIPHSTPFVLDVVATDADDDVLTYNWEQIDNELGTMPPVGTNTQGPMFRSIFATTDSKRYFPNINSVATGVPFQWEVLPTVDRNMEFRVTVRDNTFAPGCTDEQDIMLDVEGSAGPFLVTSQNSATTWQESESVTITWDVSNTDVAPVSCDLVDILISYDGGLTYPVTMLESTPNDGSAVAAVPVGVTSTARIMVKCKDNVFFNINSTNIVITAGGPSFVVKQNPTIGKGCDNLSFSYTLESSSISGYTDPITITVSDFPLGASTTVSNNPLTPGNDAVITIDGLDGLVGTYNIKTTAVSGSISREVNYNLTVEESSPIPVMSSPENGTTVEILSPTLSWNNASGATSYEYEVSTTTNGGNVVRTGSTVLPSVVISPDLEIATTYFWRVRSMNNCGNSAWSEERTFETRTCIVKSAADLPILISETGTPTITSSFKIADKGTVSDLNVVGLIGTHSYVSDLNFTLISPDNTSQTFWSDPCGSLDDFNINFDDEAASSDVDCPPTGGMTYIPDNPLSIFDTKQIQGDWTLSVFDDFDDDGGSLTSWGIEICLDDYCDLTVDDSAFTITFGTLNSALNCATDGDTIYLETAIASTTIDIGSGSIIIDEDIVIIAGASDNIRVVSEGTSPTFIINAGKTVSLIGFDIENGDTTQGVIENNGTLTLIDMDVTAGAGNISIQNQNGASMIVEGECRLQEE